MTARTRRRRGPSATFTGVPPRRDPVVLSIPVSGRIAVAFAGLLLLGVLAVLIAVLVSLEGTRSEIRTTRMGVTAAEQRFERVTERLQPLLDATAPLADESSRADLREAGRSLSEAAGDVPALADDARRGVGAATFIAQTLQAADLGGSLTGVRWLTDSATRLLADLDQDGRRSLTACDRQLQTGAPSDSGQVACLLRVVPNIRALLRAQRRLNRTSVKTQRGTLSLNRRIHALLAESLSIQREILERTRSLDRKTGGPAPRTLTAP